MEERKDLIGKIKTCINYCKEQNQNSNGEILEELDSDDFVDMMNIIDTILAD